MLLLLGAFEANSWFLRKGTSLFRGLSSSGKLFDSLTIIFRCFSALFLLRYSYRAFTRTLTMNFRPQHFQRLISRINGLPQPVHLSSDPSLYFQSLSPFAYTTVAITNMPCDSQGAFHSLERSKNMKLLFCPITFNLREELAILLSCLL